MDDYIGHPLDAYIIPVEAEISSRDVQAQINAIEQNQPKYLEEVQKFNSTTIQRICAEKYTNNFVFSMV
jgi:hypothetical protein